MKLFKIMKTLRLIYFKGNAKKCHRKFCINMLKFRILSAKIRYIKFLGGKKNV